MSNIIKLAKKEIARLESMLKTAKRLQKRSPDGSLKHCRKGNKIYYYAQTKNVQTNQWERTYIRKENLSLAEKLAQKQYLASIKPSIEENLCALKDFVAHYHPETPENAFLSLHTDCQKLITPLPDTREARTRQWLAESYEANPFHPENLRFETDQGEIVRSKSEMIIANLLFQHKEDLLYKYERPLSVIMNGRLKSIYPDFTILNLHTGDILYWEHAGRLDDDVYANEFTKKLNTYSANQLLPGRDIILTFETSETPLDTSLVRQLIRQMCGESPQ